MLVAVMMTYGQGSEDASQMIHGVMPRSPRMLVRHLARALQQQNAAAASMPS